MSDTASASGAAAIHSTSSSLKPVAQNLKSHSTQPCVKAQQDSLVQGRTPDGTIFSVPHTEDMVRTLFDPRVKKSLTDLIIVCVLSFYVLLYFILPSALRIPVYCILFAFWRLAYNAGIGWLLSQQSNHKRLTLWAKNWKLFDVKNSNTLWQKVLKHDFASKLGPSYDFYTVPLEYNTWILFRHVVDLILMSDFTNYMMLAVSCFSWTSQPWYMISLRWIAGLILFFFNLWVKLDAHRVVKDFAWYWGDFFFLEDVELTFDGVFEMAPHPMYSIGYAGFYGICLITSSYTLFFASILAHAAQFAFLIIVENPHIEKTYSPRVPPKRKSTLDNESKEKFSEVVASISSQYASSSNSHVTVDDEIETPQRPPLLIFSNIHLTRPSDVLTILLSFYSLLIVSLPDTTFWYFFTLSNALFWRIFLSFGLGFALRKQSQNKYLTRLFLKYGRSASEAYEQWQVIYNVSTIQSYISLLVLAVRNWHNPLERPYWLFLYIIGFMLVALQTWTSWSIFESLGSFGWFFGDFFFPEKSPKLTYSGIYRYLNNPERLFGIAGVWGLVLLTGSFSVTLLAFAWTFGIIFMIQFVEHPHMQKLYGGQIRPQSGVVKTIKRAAASKIPPPVNSTVRKFQGSIDKVLTETAQAVETFLEPKFKTGVTEVKGVVKDTQVLLKEYPARLTIVRLSEEIGNLDVSKFSLEIVTPLTASSNDSLVFTYGQEITVRWTADPNHSIKDWIGVYNLVDNSSEEVTKVSSKGRWSAIDTKGFTDHIDTVRSNHGSYGEVIFKGDALPWCVGTYQFRYHVGGKHNCVAISAPFSIVIPKINDSLASATKKNELDSVAGNTTMERSFSQMEISSTELGSQLLPMIQQVFVTSDYIPPLTTQEPWDLEDMELAKRVAYAVKFMTDVDLAPEVLQSDKSVGQLVTRLELAKEALRPFTAKKDI